MKKRTYQRKNKYNKLEQDGLPYKLNEKLKAGVQKTITEWADYFDKPYSHIMVTLCWLRRREEGEYHPSTEKIKVGNTWKMGIVIDINKNKESLEKGFRKYDSDQTIPRLTSSIRIAENGADKHPTMLLDMQEQMNEMLQLMVDSNKRMCAKRRLLLKEGK